jgi:hypothetical protein
VKERVVWVESVIVFCIGQSQDSLSGQERPRVQQTEVTTIKTIDAKGRQDTGENENRAVIDG